MCPVCLACTNLKVTHPVYIQVNAIVRGSNLPMKKSLDAGTIYVCHRGNQDVDFVIYDVDRRLFVIQASQSPYFHHKKKYDDLDIEPYSRAVKVSQESDRPKSFQYIYITTSKSLMKNMS